MSTPRRFPGSLNPFTIALLAVVLLLGTTGGAVAGALITGKQIQDGTVTGADLANGSVTGADIASSTVTGADVRASGLTGSDIADEARMWGAVDSSTFEFPFADLMVLKTLTSPKGYLQINANLEVGDKAGSAGVDDLLYAVFVDDKQVNVVHGLDLDAEGAVENGSLTVVIPVGAGTHVVELWAAQQSPGADEGGTDYDFISYGSELSVVYTASAGTNGTFVTKTRPGRIVH